MLEATVGSRDVAVKEIQELRNELSSEVAQLGRELDEALVGAIEALDTYTNGYVKLKYFDATYVEQYNKMADGDAQHRLKVRLDLLANVSEYTDVASELAKTLREIRDKFGYND